MGEPRADLDYDLRFAGQNDWADRLGRLKDVAPAPVGPTKPSDALAAARSTTREGSRARPDTSG